MAAAIKDFNEFVIKDERVEVIALPFRDGVNIVQRRYSLALSMYCTCDCAGTPCTANKLLKHTVCLQSVI